MSIVKNICGIEPEGFIKPDISSDPNFIFKNDLNYQTRQLFDSEGNTVLVNSYIECQHYVVGGWDFTPTKTLETKLQGNLIYVMILLVVLSYFKKRIKTSLWN
jgi:hypothetical protein|tara:strand:- start:3855 stop:4163 length:309 start_codon:yes stop_codon:yes gene_type:complete